MVGRNVLQDVRAGMGVATNTELSSSGSVAREALKVIGAE